MCDILWAFGQLLLALHENALFIRRRLHFGMQLKRKLPLFT